MIALVACIAAGLFAAGIITGVIGVVSVAIHREDRPTLERQATGNLARTGRWLTGLRVGPLPGGTHREITLVSPTTHADPSPSDPIPQALRHAGRLAAGPRQPRRAGQAAA